MAAQAVLNKQATLIRVVTAIWELAEMGDLVQEEEQGVMSVLLITVAKVAWEVLQLVATEDLEALREMMVILEEMERLGEME